MSAPDESGQSEPIKLKRNPQGIDWSGLKAAAIALQSVNDAARRASANLPPNEQARFMARVNKRAYRERWLDQAAITTLSAPTNAKAMSQPVLTGSELLLTQLKQDADQTKSDLSTGIKAAAKYIKNLPGAMLMAGAQNVKHIVGAASQIHGWDTQHSGGSISLNILTGQAAVQINTKPAQE